MKNCRPTIATLLCAVLFPAFLAGQPQTTAQLEANLKTQPDSVDLHISLIREYFRLSGQDSSAEDARVHHVLWLLEHHPEHKFLLEPAVTVGRSGANFDTLKAAWLAAVGKPDVTAPVLANAANFFRPLDPSRSIDLLTKARAADPKNGLWTGLLAEMYVFRIVGITGLNQNGLPTGVDPTVAASAEAERYKAMLLASKDVELVVNAAGQLEMRGAMAAMVTNRREETAALAETLFQRAISLEPQKAQWHGALAGHYTRQYQPATGETRATLIRKAMAEYDRQAAMDPATVEDQSYARTAIDGGDLDKATTAAKHCLAEAPTQTLKYVAVHQCNLILGRVALRRGDLKGAGEYLLAAAQIEGQGALSSFGPNMALAKELLEKDQRDVVLEYFRLCAKFWSFDRGQLDKWTAQVKAGQIPEFGGNLVY